MNQRAKYLSEMSFSIKVVRTHRRLTRLPEGLFYLMQNNDGQKPTRTRKTCSLDTSQLSQTNPRNALRQVHRAVNKGGRSE